MQIPKKVLITQGQLVNYSGSEIITLELAEHLSSLGVEVTILTHFFSKPVSTEFKNLPNVRVVVSGTDDARNIDVKDFDLLWVHHLTFTRSMVRQLANRGSRPAVVFHHMSKSEPLEFPLMSEAENKLADAVAFNSQETYDDLHAQGAEFDREKVVILGNPAPDAFADDAHHHGAEVRTVAVVSNHPPKELIDAAGLLSKRGVQVDLFGRMESGTTARVTPELLSKYDVVVSIGKTVQYCIVAGIPVYCYDRFGGPGFLNAANFPLSRQNNFSGRGFHEKTAEQIVAEVIGGFTKASDGIEMLRLEHGKEFLLSQKLKELIVAIDSSERPRQRLSMAEENSLASYAEVLGKLTHSMLRWKDKATEAGVGLDRLRAANKQLEEETRRLRAELEAPRKRFTNAGRAVKNTFKKLID